MSSDWINTTALACLILFSLSCGWGSWRSERSRDFSQVSQLVRNIAPSTLPQDGMSVSLREVETKPQVLIFHMVHCCQCCRNNQANEFSPGDSARCSCFSSLSWNWIKCDHKADFPWKYKAYKVFHFIRNDSSKNNLSKLFTLKCLFFEAGRPKLIHS